MRKEYYEEKTEEKTGELRPLESNADHAERIKADYCSSECHIHGIVSNIRLSLFMRYLINFLKQHIDMVPVGFLQEFNSLDDSAIKKLELMAMLRASGRKRDDGRYEDGGRGIDYREDGKENAKAYFKEHVDEVNDKETEKLAQAIVDCENNWEEIHTFESWLLKISTSIETLRDTRSKTVDINTFPFYSTENQEDKEAFRVLVMTHYVLIREQQGFDCVTLTDSEEPLFKNTRLDTESPKFQSAIDRLKNYGRNY